MFKDTLKTPLKMWYCEKNLDGFLDSTFIEREI